MPVILTVDPGTAKCGLAVLSGARNRPIQTLHREIAPVGAWLERVAELIEAFNPEQIIIGTSTGSMPRQRELKAALLERIPIIPVSEDRTSEEARRRYFMECPPRGLRRFLPTSLQTPPEPYDDWAAVILGERYLQAS